MKYNFKWYDWLFFLVCVAGCLFFFTIAINTHSWLYLFACIVMVIVTRKTSNFVTKCNNETDKIKNGR